MSSVGIFQLREIPIGDLEKHGTHCIKVMVSKIQNLLTLSYKKGKKNTHDRHDLKSSIKVKTQFKLFNQKLQYYYFI